MRVAKLPTINADIAGPIDANAQIGVEFAPVGVSHSLCVDFIRVTVSDNADPPNGETVDIPVIYIQPEMIVQTPDGPYDHVWDDEDPERPSYLGITDGRCRCETLCI